ncbi:MAG: IPT/TIG domain-containing protein, partial [Actinomycetota bacterium]
GSGGAIITWQDYRSGKWDIYAQRVNASGTPQWTADGVGIRTASSINAASPHITSDGSGGAIITWQDYRSGKWDIYARRVDASGTPQWAADGVGLRTAAAGSTDYPQITSDGSGGAIITWQDYRSGKWDIYARRVDASGTPQWAADGVGLRTAAANGAASPQITSDGSGGAIVTWQDYRSGSKYDIYSQRVDHEGNPLWDADGVGLRTAAANDASYAQVAPDSSGGAIVTWRDERSGSKYDIYAQRVSNPAPTVTVVSPNICSDGGVVTINDLSGTWFSDVGGAPDVRLQKSGQPDIVAGNVVVVSGGQITCDFDLSGAAVGVWDVQVQNPDGQSGTRAGALTVTHSYDVNASVAGGHGVVAPATQTVFRLGSASVYIYPDPHYHVAAIWDNGALQSNANPYVITGVLNDHDVEVVFAPDTYSVDAVVSGGGGAVNPATQTVNHGENAFIDITPDPGYHIASIEDNGSYPPIANPYVITGVASDHTVIVTFALDTLAVNAFALGGHGTVVPVSQSTEYSGTATVYIYPDPHYQVASIWDNGAPQAVANPYVINNVVEDHDVYVVFALDNYTVDAAVSGGGGTVNPDTQKVNHGENAAINITPDPGYHIASIEDNGAYPPIANPYVISGVAADHTVVVTFALNTYTVTASIEWGHGIILPAVQAAEFGDNASILIWPDTGYKISAITDNGVPQAITNQYFMNYGVMSIAEDHEVKVTFGEDRFNVYANVFSGSGEVDPATQEVECPDPAYIVINPDPGYHIVRIEDNGVVQPPVADPYHSCTYTIESVREEHVVMVSFEKNDCTVRASVPGGHGTVAPAAQTVVYKNGATISIYPDPGYHIASIWDNGAMHTVANPYVIDQVLEDHNVYVVFAIDTFTIDADCDPIVGTVFPEVQTVDYGATASIGINPEPGYRIVSIVDNGVVMGAASPYVIAGVDADHFIEVYMLPQDFTVTASVLGGHGAAAPPTQKVYYGEAASVTIYPDPGYRIASIWDNGALQAVSNPYAIANVTYGHDVAVVFALIPTPAIYSVSPTVGQTGTEVTIDGANFGEPNESSYVSFGNVIAHDLTAWTDNQIKCLVPAGASGAVNLTVTTGGGQSDGVAFKVKPYISAMTPASGVSGTVVTVTGTGFGATQGTSYVSFGSVKATSYTSWSSTQIKVKVPAEAAGAVNLTVTTAGGKSNGTAFKVVPRITRITPTSGPVGTVVTITGTGFGATRGTSYVKFGSVKATSYASWSSTQIKVRVPSIGAGAKLIKVTTSGGTSGGVTFTVN